MQKYNYKMKLLRQKVKMIDGVPMVSKLWVEAYLTDTELKKYISKHGWHSVVKLKWKGTESRKVKRYAYFWDLHTILEGG